jgi:hypothetical protein
MQFLCAPRKLAGQGYEVSPCTGSAQECSRVSLENIRRSAGRGTSAQIVCSFGTLTILKETHHGSNTSSTPLFLSRFPPRVAVIQCGADNPYGHPTPETLERLQRVDAKVFRNDEDGDVIATIKDQELKVATTKR